MTNLKNWTNFGQKIFQLEQVYTSTNDAIKLGPPFEKVSCFQMALNTFPLFGQFGGTILNQFYTDSSSSKCLVFVILLHFPLKCSSQSRKRVFVIVLIRTPLPLLKNTLYLSHHRLMNDALIFTFYWLGSLGGVSYRVTILVCLSVCLSVASQNNHLRLSWKLLVEKCVPCTGLKSHN